jgi:hypothetical protein
VVRLTIACEVVQRREGEQARLHRREVGEVVRGEHLALDDGEVDPDLVEPGEVGELMHRDQFGVELLKTCGGDKHWKGCQIGEAAGGSCYCSIAADGYCRP